MPERASPRRCALGANLSGIDQLFRDIETAPVDKSLPPILQIARKLTVRPHDVRACHLKAITAQGWSERAVLDVIMLVGLLAFMNYFVDGPGVDHGADSGHATGRRLARLSCSGLAAWQFHD